MHKGFKKKQLHHISYHLSLQICYGHETNGKLVSTNFRQCNHVTNTSFKGHFYSVTRRMGERFHEASVKNVNTVPS